MATVRKRLGETSEVPHSLCKLSARSSSTLIDTSEPYIYTDKDRENACLQGFRELFETENLFDLSLSTEGREFRCHRAFLASSSDYFRAMFTNNLAEKDQEVVTISGVDATSMEIVVKYLYTGQAELQTGTVQNLLSAANLFQLKELKEGCAQYMAIKLDTDNCIGIHFFAQAHECEFLEFQAWDWITENFDSVADSTEFLELSHSNVVEIIKYDDLQTTEEEVYEAATKWLEHHLSERAMYSFDIFTHIRFSLIDKHYLYDKVKTNPHLMTEPRLAALIEEVIKYKLLKGRWLESDMRLEPRYGADFCRVIVYTSYLDDEKKQVLQIYGQRSDEVSSRHGNILCDLPVDMENPALLVTGDNDLYIAGGDGCGSTLYKYCSDDTTFEEMSAMPMSRKQFSLTQVDDCLYAVGGCNHDGHLNSCIVYNEERDEWDSAADIPKAVRCCCAVAHKGELYVFGGECEKMSSKKVTRGKTELSKQAFRYSPKTDTWTVLPDMSTARALAGCTVYRDKIYLIGGFGTITESWVKDRSPENCLRSVEIYDPVDNSWETGPDLPVPLCAMGVVKYYGTIYILGGENDEDVSYNVYYLSEDNKWEHKDEMVTGVTETTIHSYYSVMDIDMEM